MSINKSDKMQKKRFHSGRKPYCYKMCRFLCIVESLFFSLCFLFCFFRLSFWLSCSFTVSMFWILFAMVLTWNQGLHLSNTSMKYNWRLECCFSVLLYIYIYNWNVSKCCKMIYRALIGNNDKDKKEEVFYQTLSPPFL